jgi:hypothetical protein
VRLARSTADPLFASVDEVAAALAIPVVGIVPAAAVRGKRMTKAPLARSGWRKKALPIALALAVFTVVAYGVQSPDGLWHTCTHPLEAIARLSR